MRQLVWALVGLFFTFMSFNTFAHPGGHGGPPLVADCKAAGKCTKDEVTDAAKKIVKDVADSGKVDKSWKDVKSVSSADKKESGGYTLWTVIFNNPKEKDKEKQNIFVFITSEGFLLGASHKNTMK